VDRLCFTVPWRGGVGADGQADVAQVDRQGCALILCEHWPEKVGKGLMFISLNVEPPTHEAVVATSFSSTTRTILGSSPRVWSVRKPGGLVASPSSQAANVGLT
jgi:hypothetical protein